MSETFVMPAAFVERARQFYATGGRPVVPRVAATVVLLRPGPQVYLIRRAASMAFASGMYAFPGGSVDPRDATAHIRWAGPSDVDWARRLNLSAPDRARAVVCAAVRELFEESGVLLSDVPDTRGEQWEVARRALVSRQVSLGELLAERGLALRSDLLVPWTRWITPEFEPRRFDTYFFLAVMPEGQDARDVSGEADHTLWVHPREALDYPMLPPTVVMLRDLAAYPDVASALAAAADREPGTPVLPRLDGDRLVITPRPAGPGGVSRTDR